MQAIDLARTPDSSLARQNPSVAVGRRTRPSWSRARSPTVSVTERIDAAQRRFRVLGFPIAVVYKFFDDHGNYLAALIAYYGFLSFFPLLLLLSSILGYTLAGNPDLQRQVLDSALSQFPVIGQQLTSPTGLKGNATAVIVGIAASVYGGMGVAQAVQHAMNTAWNVPIVHRPNPVLARL